MQLYKPRTFTAYFQSTFAFAKENGKHYFKNYFITNGVFLLILLVLGYIFSKMYTDVLFGSFIGSDVGAFEDFASENALISGILILLFLVVALVASVLSYSYTPIYLKLYEKESNANFDSKEIIREYKLQLGKLVIFILSSLLIAIPLFFVIGLLIFILAITIIGILAIPFVIGGLTLFYYMALSEYLKNEKTIWESFGYSWDLLKSKFWKAIGGVGLFYLMAYIAQNIIIVVPYILGLASFYSSNTSPSIDDTQVIMKVLILLVFFLTFILGVLLNNIIQLNHGIIYYSLKEENENINTKSIIDQIGNGL